MTIENDQNKTMKINQNTSNDNEFVNFELSEIKKNLLNKENVETSQKLKIVYTIINVKLNINY